MFALNAEVALVVSKEDLRGSVTSAANLGYTLGRLEGMLLLDWYMDHDDEPTLNHDFGPAQMALLKAVKASRGGETKRLADQAAICYAAWSASGAIPPVTSQGGGSVAMIIIYSAIAAVEFTLRNVRPL